MRSGSTRERKTGVQGRVMQETAGQSLIEIAVMLPVLLLLVAYAVDFGYFFIAAANITSAAHHAVQYSIMGFEGPGQTTVPVAGPVSVTSSVAAAAMADMASLLNASTTTSVQVCTKSLGMNGKVPKCSNYGPASTAYTPLTDPEAPTFVLQRVDVTYTVQPPIPLSFFSVPLLPTFQFHRQVSMRAID